MRLDHAELSNATFRTTRAADDICGRLTAALGWRHRYVAARLAIARSLSLPDPPPLLTREESGDMAIPLRGMQLLGEGSEQAAWLALITQRSADPEISKRSFQALVTAHWKRGAELLEKDWERSERDMTRFVARLAELAGFRGDTKDGGDNVSLFRSQPAIAVGVSLSVGEVAQDARTDESVEFVVNEAGGSPHMAILGGVGSGKTRTAVHMLKNLRHFGDAPLLAFDFKGDLAEGLQAVYDAEILRPPKTVIPLDVLHVTSSDNNAVKSAAGRIRDSISSVKSRKPTGIQADALREAVTTTLRKHVDGTAVALPDLARALVHEYEERSRAPDDLTATLNELTQFDLFTPINTPATFFAKSWIIQLPQDSSEEMRRLIINLILNALDRWLNGQPDAPIGDGGVRALRHVTLLDEAHVVLRTKLPALGNLVRMSRSKGGVLLLASQSPDDFESVEEGYLDNMGLTLAFNTQARPGPTRRIFGEGYALTSLKPGEAFCRIRSEAKTRRIVAWRS